MKTVIVVESCFGNTAQVARAVSDGLGSGGAEVHLYEAHEAPAELTADLVVVAAPTHNGALPGPRSRAQAAAGGATGAPARGVREWLGDLRGITGRVLALSTTTGGRYDGSAAKATVKALRRRKVVAERGPDFVVTGRAGPLADGELDRAHEWARGLAAAAA